VVIGEKAEDPEKEQMLKSNGVMIIRLSILNGRFDLRQFFEKLLTPEGAFHGLTSVLVEGGAKTWQAFRESGVVDEELTQIGK
jgi:riboflavin biosynthesis pyrimidine reductase